MDLVQLSSGTLILGKRTDLFSVHRSRTYLAGCSTFDVISVYELPAIDIRSL